MRLELEEHFPVSPIFIQQFTCIWRRSWLPVALGIKISIQILNFKKPIIQSRLDLKGM